MKTLVVFAEKGGAGKTAIATNLAISAKRDGLTVVLADIDPQQTAFKWFEKRKANGHDSENFVTLKVQAQQLHRVFEKSEKAGVDLVIVDTAGRTSKEAIIACRQADLVLIPCRTAPGDLDSLDTSLALVNETGKPHAIVINSALFGRLGGNVLQELKKRDVPIFNSILHQRAAHVHSAFDGRSVHEYDPDGKAEDEIEALYSILKRGFRM